MIPLRYWLYIGLVVGALFAINYALDQAYDRGVSDQVALQAKVDGLLTDLRNADKERIENDTRNRIQTITADADHARNIAYGLRGQLDEIKRIASDHTGTFAPGTSARDAVLLLADLLQQCGERYTKMAGFADAAHEAGKACERQYDSLRIDHQKK